jgi:hypothetical protein
LVAWGDEHAILRNHDGGDARVILDAQAVEFENDGGGDARRDGIGLAGE